MPRCERLCCRLRNMLHSAVLPWISPAKGICFLELIRVS